jgi:proteasome lid subunit RPN8/RPN11
MLPVAADDAIHIRSAEDVFPVARRVWDEMVRHCLEQLPNEACGLLSGKNGRAKTIWMMDNVEHSPVSFSMDEGQIRKAFQLMENMGEELVGIYHSHPTAPAFPSSQDMEHVSYPEAAYLIVSLADLQPTVGCFRIREKQAIPLPVFIY